ncbi:FAD binding domain-containing protein [Desarmillaria ectypa]|nr:FAD binding domain-containing protein [Desarmillaria ectypa]
MTDTVLIVGAGPSGLVLALSLIKNGVPVRIIDKERSNYKVGQKGSGVHPRTMEVYKLLGVLPDILEESGKSHPLIMYEPDGVSIKVRMPMSEELESTPDRPIINPILIGQDAHEEVLRNHLVKFGCVVETGTELVSFEQSPDRVTAHLLKWNDANEQVPETAEVAWLVGTDGGKSTVRKQLGLTFMGETKSAERWVVGDIQVINSPLDQSSWHVWGDASSRTVSLRPYLKPGDDRYYIIAAGPELNRERMASGREGFIQEFREITKRNDINFGQVIFLSQFQVNVRMVNKFGVGRVFVAGDAAHVHSPTGGQGINTGVLDTNNLAWKLALVHKHLAPPTLLETYNAERLPVVAAMLECTTELFNKTFKRADDNHTGWFRGYILRQFGVTYRGSPIVVDETNPGDEAVDPYRSGLDGRVQGGDRAPEAPGLVDADGGKVALFDSFGPAHHTVLVFSDDMKVHVEVLDRLGSYSPALVKPIIILPKNSAVKAEGDMLKDEEGYAYKHYNIEDGTSLMVVVRPDGVVGARLNTAEGLKLYFQPIFL